MALKAVSRLEQGRFSPRPRLGAHLWCRLPRALPIAEHPTASHTPAPCSPGAQGGRFSPAPAGRRAAGFLPPEPRGWWGQSRRPARLAERGPRPRHLPTRDEAGHRLCRPRARASENLGLPAWLMIQTDRQRGLNHFLRGKKPALTPRGSSCSSGPEASTEPLAVRDALHFGSHVKGTPRNAHVTDEGKMVQTQTEVSRLKVRLGDQQVPPPPPRTPRGP